MVGQVPGKLLYYMLKTNSTDCGTGLLELQADTPIKLTASMAKGYDMGVVVLLDYVESLATFFTHPSHDEYVQTSFSRGSLPVLNDD